MIPGAGPVWRCKTQQLSNLSPRCLQTVSVLQAEAEFVIKHNVVPFRCQCPPFIASLTAQTNVVSSQGLLFFIDRIQKLGQKTLDGIGEQLTQKERTKNNCCILQIPNLFSPYVALVGGSAVFRDVRLSYNANDLKISSLPTHDGLTGYFRKFIPAYSVIAKPLSDLLRKDTPFNFDVKKKLPFDELKRLLCQKPVLGIYRQNCETEIHTDASIDGLAAVLL
ncbi:transposon Tf2-6 polyprotein [Trichonephila clavipes]|nr:transposon Tf2-6 polyprotein [Trichonephila clavipes]